MTDSKKEQSSIRIEKKTFLTAFFILAAHILIVEILTQIIPMGSCDRQIVDDRDMVVQGTFHF